MILTAVALSLSLSGLPEPAVDAHVIVDSTNTQEVEHLLDSVVDPKSWEWPV